MSERGRGGWVRVLHEDGLVAYVLFRPDESTSRLVADTVLVTHEAEGEPLSASAVRSVRLNLIESLAQREDLPFLPATRVKLVGGRVTAPDDVAAYTVDLSGGGEAAVWDAASDLTLPETDEARRDKGDAFYRQVAWKYQARAGVSHRPVSDLAEANNVPVSTVRRWVKEARRRGFMPAGKHGSAG